MTFDEQHGWVERGTPGVHSGAVVRDVAAEVAALDRIHARPIISPHLAEWRRFDVAVWGATAREAQQWVEAALTRRRYDATTSTTYAVEGDTLRIVHTATMPARAQTVNVTMTIGGE